MVSPKLYISEVGIIPESMISNIKIRDRADIYMSLMVMRAAEIADGAIAYKYGPGWGPFYSDSSLVRLVWLPSCSLTIPASRFERV